MTGEDLERFLTTDPRDVGCERTMELLDVYAELILAGVDVEQRYPGAAAHLRARRATRTYRACSRRSHSADGSRAERPALRGSALLGLIVSFGAARRVRVPGCEQAQRGRGVRVRGCAVGDEQLFGIVG